MLINSKRHVIYIIIFIFYSGGSINIVYNIEDVKKGSRANSSLIDNKHVKVNKDL
jgi:uncharacterized membrane protein